MKERNARLFPVALLVLMTLLAGLLIGLYRSQDPWLLDRKRYIKYNVLHLHHAAWSAETQGLPWYVRSTLYVDGRPTTDYEYNEESSMDRVYRTKDVTRLVNYHDGYQLDFPAGTEFDFSKSAIAVTGQGEGFRVTVTKEYCMYAEPNQEMTDGLAFYAPDFPWETGMDQYIGHYQSRFLLNREWQENNRVSVTPAEVFDGAGHKGYVYHAVLDGMESGDYDAFSYFFVRYEDQDFLRVVVKYHSENTALRDSLETMFDHFRTFAPVGWGRMETDYHPVLPEDWSPETRALYDRLAGSEDVLWGIYTDDVYGSGVREKIPALEAALEHRFGLILAYTHTNMDFPTEFMEENWEQGRTVELTYQLTENNNEDMRGYSPLLDLYRGVHEERVREFAQKAKEFGHPFLFRLCNEMNSDWTSYGGVNNMADPEVFVTVWRRIYEIFREEGVDNCIWIFNPNDRNCPPCRWNEGSNYYPGNEYVQMLGVTGYNNGTYYEKWAEEWREFDQIYDAIEDQYLPLFGSFPWIITEFASSSIGGDKAAWIENMFEHIHDYPNIKAAVWFSSADYDGETPARPYWLDETPETLAAFKKGLQEIMK